MVVHSGSGHRGEALYHLGLKWQEGSYQNTERKTKKEQALSLRREMQPDHHHPIASDGGVTLWMLSTSTLRSPLITPLVKSMRSQRTRSHRAASWSPEQLGNAGEGLWKGKGKCPPRNHSALPWLLWRDTDLEKPGMLGLCLEDTGPEGLLGPPIILHEQEMILC